MTCKITCYAEFERDGHVWRSEAPAQAVCRCETHNMPMADPVGMGDLCPIGKIEAATQDALARIEAAKQ
jgi:hypothetical protein